MGIIRGGSLHPEKKNPPPLEPRAPPGTSTPVTASLQKAIPKKTVMVEGNEGNDENAWG